MPDLNQLSPNALSAAMRGGTDGWGEIANSHTHIRYIELVSPRSRKHCLCGCRQRGTHRGFCNGLALTRPRCHLSAMRWVKTGE
ncbi:MAG: hypothetical protein BWK73_09315 [Thiothrix lacustris]|uniref:Uncharacterized protein n=1 Tax=Thiothrix lacustris TaxID=525917 RepID=A0A1Y1QV78_9GAMM|nr:MAG: hypothetical protein BWK73_09315 [Thiothrix lacustris]